MIKALALLFFGGAIRAAVLSEKPNFLVILADDLGFADVGWHGSTQVKTPNLDWLAKRGTVLTRHYAQPICTPSRGALMTGYYPIKTGLQVDVITAPRPCGLPLHFNTMPQIFRERAGYKTHLVGKWHLGFFKKEYTPTYRGFDTFFGLYGGVATYFTHEVGTDDSRKASTANFRVNGVDFNDNFGTSLNTAGHYFGNYSDDLFGDRAAEIVMNHNIDSPLFLYLSFQGVHDPLEAKSQYNREFPHIWTWERRQYAMQLLALDENVGKVIEALRRRRMLDDTYILFSSDNGGLSTEPYMPNFQGSNYPLRGTKWTYFEGGLRVPAFIKGPGIPQQVTYDNYVHITDWLPTFYSAIGGDVADLGPIDGIDQLEALRANAREGPRKEFLVNIDPTTEQAVIVSGRFKLHTANHGMPPIIEGKQWSIPDGWYHDSGPLGQNNTHRVHHIGDWRLPIVTCNDTDRLGETCDLRSPDSICLFDIMEDPCEYNNIASRHPRVVATLLDKIARYRSQVVPAQLQGPDPKSDPALHGGFWVPWM